jgi:hypothetical protein
VLYDQYFIDDLKQRADLVRRFLVVALCALAFVVSGGAQETPEAVLVDELGPIPCGDLSSRLDGLLNELEKDPNSTGYIVFSDNEEAASRLHWRALFVDGYARFRSFDEDRVVLLQATLDKPIDTQMWRIPAGGNSPVPSAVERPYELDASLRKYRLYSEFEEVGACYTGPPFRVLSKYLQTNPDLVANIAIGAPSAKSFRQAKEETIKLFRVDYGVEPTRLRFFWKQTDYEPPIYELWLLRKKSK